MGILDLWSVVLAFAVTLVLGRLTLVGLSAVAWKKLEIVTVCIAALGIIGATYKAQDFVFTDVLKGWDSVVAQNAEFTAAYANRSREVACSASGDATGVRSPCAWFTQNADGIANALKMRTPIHLTPFEGPSSDPNSPGSVAGMEATAAWFNDTLARRQRAATAPESTASLKRLSDVVDTIATLAAPYFIAISAALKLTQLWAEIREDATP